MAPSMVPVVSRSILFAGLCGLSAAACSFDPGGAMIGPTEDARHPDDGPMPADTGPTPDGSGIDAPPAIDAPPPIDAAPPDCWTNSNYDQVAPDSGHRYYIFRAAWGSTRNWTDARDVCAGHQAHLVVVDDDVENTFVRSFLGNDVLWIGFHDRDTEGNFEWISGAPVGFTNWRVDEPNNSNDEDCTEMDSDGLWNDIDCGQGRRFLCECDPGYVP